MVNNDNNLTFNLNLRFATQPSHSSETCSFPSLVPYKPWLVFSDPSCGFQHAIYG